MKLHRGVPARLAGIIVVGTLAFTAKVAADEVGHTCVAYCGGDSGPSYYYVPPPPPDPRHVRGDELFHLGDEAWARHDWEAAAAYYRDAAETGGNQWPSASAAWSNYNKAMSNLYDGRASAAWDRRDWARAIDLYRQSLGFYESEGTRSNLRKAQGLQSDEWAVAAYNRGNLDEAILYWRQAYQFYPDPSYLDSLQKAEKKKLANRVTSLMDDSRSAYSGGRLDEAEARAREALRLQPGSQDALELLADIEVRRGRPSSGSLDDRLAAQDHAIGALLKLRAAGAASSWFEGTARNSALSAGQDLMRSARSNAEREKIAAAYSHWARTLGQVGIEVTSDWRSITSDQFFGMASAGEMIPAAAPSTPNPGVRAGAAVRANPAARPSPAVVAATDLVNAALDRPSVAPEPSAAAPLGMCFDNSCGGLHITRFQKSTHDLFLPQNEETSDMQKIHATIVNLRKKLSEAQRQADPSQRAALESDLTRQIADQGKRYEAEAKKKVSHGIVPNEVPR